MCANTQLCVSNQNDSRQNTPVGCRAARQARGGRLHTAGWSVTAWAAGTGAEEKNRSSREGERRWRPGERSMGPRTDEERALLVLGIPAR